MSARTIVHAQEDARRCAECGAVVELKRLGQRHVWECPRCGYGTPAAAGEIAELRRYASAWDRRVSTLRRRFVRGVRR